MNAVFVDTSAIFALLVADDRRHADAVRAWDASVAESGCRIVTSNYVVAESYDLTRRRLGIDALRVADTFVRTYLEIVFVARQQHERARTLLISRATQDLSLVDCASVVIARDEEVDAVFAYDRHFEDERFTLL